MAGVEAERKPRTQARPSNKHMSTKGAASIQILQVVSASAGYAFDLLTRELSAASVYGRDHRPGSQQIETAERSSPLVLYTGVP